MSVSTSFLERFLAAGPAVLVDVAEALGSTPREAGTFMLVSARDQLGTIGGGQLELLAVEHARKLLTGAAGEGKLSIPLGPGIGQCCGGRVVLEFAYLAGPVAADLTDRVRAARAARPFVYIFGAGHVGRALAVALAPLPFNTIVVDLRADQLRGLPEEVEAITSPMPEAQVRKAPAGSAFVAVTHDHALDFLITGEALARDDAFYVGMIGSKTKRAQFRRWYVENGGDQTRLSRLVCPIGGKLVGDKSPEVIAALTAAELVCTVSRDSGSLPVANGTEMHEGDA